MNNLTPLISDLSALLESARDRGVSQIGNRTALRGIDHHPDDPHRLDDLDANRDMGLAINLI